VPSPGVLFGGSDESDFYSTMDISTCLTKTSLAPGETCTFGIRFARPSAGTSNDTAKVGEVVVSLTGTAATLVVAPTSLDFGVIAVNTASAPKYLTVTNTASNANLHSVIAGYGLVDAPAGMSIDGSGIITWTPGQSQSPGTNTIVTVVTNSNPYDQLNPQLTATNSFTVIVTEVNSAPVLPVQTNRILTAARRWIIRSSNTPGRRIL